MIAFARALWLALVRRLAAWLGYVLVKPETLDQAVEQAESMYLRVHRSGSINDGAACPVKRRIRRRLQYGSRKLNHSLLTLEAEARPW